MEWRIDGPSLDAFEGRYVFASAVAKRHHASVQTIANRIRSAGLIPVSGPDIDGGVTYVFDRSSLSGVDLAAVVTGPYQSRAGRKKGGLAPDRMGVLTSRETAAVLGISVRQLREVIGRGWIQPTKVICRRRMFDEAVVRDLKRALDEDFCPLEVAASAMQQTVAQFRRTWINTGTIEARPFAAQVLVAKADLERIQQTWNELGSASSIGRQLSRPRWLCANLQKMTTIPAPTIIGSGTSKVRLFPRASPEFEKYRST